MGLLDTFNCLNAACSFEQAGEEAVNEIPKEFDKSPSDPHVWLDRYATFTERPRFNPNIDGYISPYSSNHWGASSDIMQSITTGMELGPLRDKVDPNKIFTADIAALKTLAADQQKVVKLFERKMIESLSDKGKFGLNEDDIEAMQALTSARSAITAINKEQIAVKAKIAELKIKQQQANGAGGGSQTASDGGRGANVFDVGRSIMDNLFDVSIAPPSVETVPATAYPTINPDQAASVLDDIVDAGSVAATTAYEADKPTTYVVVGDDDSDREFVTLSASGEILSDYPNPGSKIQSVDRDTKTAVDEFLVSYPVKYKSEIM